MTNPKEYGRALFLLAEEEGSTEEVLSDAVTVREVFREHGDYAKLLNTPALEKEERLRLADESLKTVNKHLKSLVKILAQEHAAHTVASAIDGFIAAYEESRGIEHATVISAVPLSDTELSRLKEKLERLTSKTFIIECEVDPSILGGIKLRYMGRQLDSSLRTKLDSFANNLMKTIV
ncbi:MAG: ATP synthase F1 subunit delta [Clostridia bacterium]|nr:ATP synthase F1 subunit delta [Clostridia bacterium]